MHQCAGNAGFVPGLRKDRKVMTDKENKQLLMGEKAARVIVAISELHHVSLEEATDLFYTSETAELINEGIADLHCRSSKYLANEIWEEKKAFAV